MYWADSIARDIVSSGKYKPYWVDDMKTPSGFAHVGSMLGPVIHSLIYRSLKDLGQKPKFTFVINDFDPVDGLPEDLEKEYSKYLGYPLKTAPSPNPKFTNMAEYYANDFINSFRYLGVEAEILSSWEMYQDGKFDELIRRALDCSEKIQDIYQKISGSKKREKEWLPFQVICPNCGKLGTTRVFEWDGKEVSYKCEPNLVAWAKGCGHEGKVSPFGGTGKLPWKVDWPAHWKVIGVTIEGAGKDHASAGGSYDVAMAICKEVFKFPQPRKLPYEFLLIGGRKMSSSKGLGIKAHDLIGILPPELGRFLFARHKYTKQSDFNPKGTMAIPDLFDEYDKAWTSYNENDGSDLARTFELSQIGNVPERKDVVIPRFREVVNYLQQPSIDIHKAFPGADKNLLEERIRYAEIWIEKYSPEEYMQQMSTSLPQSAKDLSSEQKKYLTGVSVLVRRIKDPEKLQKDLYELAKAQKLETKKAFAAIYQAFIGKDHGPKAAWFLLQYPKEKVIARLEEASK